MADAAVVAVPDDVMGEKVGAVVVPLPGTTFDAKPVVEYLSERLADFTVPQYKVPRYFAVSDVPCPATRGARSSSVRCGRARTGDHPSGSCPQVARNAHGRTAARATLPA